MFCGSKYTPEKKQHGYDAKVRKQAIRLYVDGMNLRRTARHLGVHHSTVSAWVKEHVSNLAQAPQPRKVKTAEMDELFTFIGYKKQNLSHNPDRQADKMCFELESGMGADLRNYSVNRR